MIEKYINEGKFDRTQLALDVKNGKITKNELIIIFELINKIIPLVCIEDPRIGNGCKDKRKKSEWNEKYLDYLVAEVSSSEVFNKESMLYLLDVTRHVKPFIKNSPKKIWGIFDSEKDKGIQLENIISWIAEEMQKLKLNNDKQMAVISTVSKLTGNVKFADADTAKKKCFCWFGYKRKRIKQLEKENAELLAVVADIKKLVDEASSSYVQKLLGVEVNTLEYKPEGTEN